MDINVDPVHSAVPLPLPYVAGGYQSPDIILTDPWGNPVPLGGQPYGPWDTLLIPDTDYGLCAVVHNASPTPAVNTVVRFWQFPGGVGSAGSLIDVQTATIPGSSSVVVQSAHPFHSAPADQPHRCAVVSISNTMSAQCSVDAVSAAQVPDPNANPAQSCSAWRNTDSRYVFIGKVFELPFEATTTIRNPSPVTIEVEALHVPHNWEAIPEIAQLRNTLREAGSDYPVHLLPVARGTLKPANLEIRVTPMGKDMKVERAPAAEPAPVGATVATKSATATHVDAFTIAGANGQPGPFRVQGTIPRGARPGDKFLVSVTARHLQNSTVPPRAINFTEILYVKG